MSASTGNLPSELRAKQWAGAGQGYQPPWPGGWTCTYLRGIESREASAVLRAAHGRTNEKLGHGVRLGAESATKTQRSDPAHSHTEVSITRRERRLGFRQRCLCPLPVYLCLGASARQEPNGGGWHASPRVCDWVCASPRLVLVICSLLDQAAVSTMLRGRRPQARMDPALSGTGGGGLHEARADPAPRRLVNMTMRSTLGGGQGTRIRR